MAQSKSGSAAKPITPIKPLPASSKWNTVKKPSVLAEVKKLGKPSVSSQVKALGKKRSLDDFEDIFERAPMKKFATDLATNLAQKAPQYAQQYTQSQQNKAKNSQPRFAQVYVFCCLIYIQVLMPSSVFNRPSRKQRLAPRALPCPKSLPTASGTL